MLKQKQKQSPKPSKNKSVNVSVRAGLGSKLKINLPLGQLNTSLAEEVARKVVDGNKANTDIRAQKAAEVLENILDDRRSDLDLRFRTVSGDIVNVSRDDLDGKNMEKLIENTEIGSLENLAEIEMGASRLASGGCE